MAVIVLAKAPVAGRVKTRLIPPCTPEQAAQLAEAALRDTLDAVGATRATRRVLVLDGRPGPWVPDGFEVIAQRGHGLDERLANAFADVGGPALLVGMDTPQVTSELLDQACHLLRSHTSVLGPADDGGYWAIGLQQPDAQVFRGVPMSTEQTGAHQLQRLRERNNTVALLAPLRDVDTWDDAQAVAALVPHTRFARLVTAAACGT
jgi:uncharacterized protein